MRVAWRRTVEPNTEPITLAEAKLHVRQTLTTDDTYLNTLIVAGRHFVEEYLARGLFTQTWKLVQDDWSEEIWLPRAAPLQSVASVQYYDENGALQTLSTSVYVTDTMSEPARIVRAPLQLWPILQWARTGAIEITYVVGWNDVALIPPAVKLGLQQLVGHWYRNREAVSDGSPTVVPFEVEALLTPYRVWWRPPMRV